MSLIIVSNTCFGIVFTNCSGQSSYEDHFLPTKKCCTGTKHQVNIACRVLKRSVCRRSLYWNWWHSNVWSIQEQTLTCTLLHHPLDATSQQSRLLAEAEDVLTFLFKQEVKKLQDITKKTFMFDERCRL